MAPSTIPSHRFVRRISVCRDSNLIASSPENPASTKSETDTITSADIASILPLDACRHNGKNVSEPVSRGGF